MLLLVISATLLDSEFLNSILVLILILSSVISSILKLSILLSKAVSASALACYSVSKLSAKLPILVSNSLSFVDLVSTSDLRSLSKVSI